MKLEINISSLKWAVLFFFLMTPGIITHIKVVSWMFDGIVVIIGILLLLIMAKSGFKFDKYVISMFLLQMWILLSTMFNRASITSGGKIFVRTLVVCFILYVIVKIDRNSTYEALISLFHIYITINTITLFLFPNAMYLNTRGQAVCWFLGEDNYAFSYYLLANILALIYLVENNTILLAVYSFVNSYLFAWKNDIATGKITIIVLSVLVLLGIIDKVRRTLNMFIITIVNIVVFYFLVINRFYERISAIIGLLGRNMTLSGRTIIWERVIDYITKKPVVGHGVYSAAMFDGTLNMNGLASAHNYYLMLAFDGGIIAIILFLYVLWILYMVSVDNPNDKISYFFMIGIFTFMFREQVENGGYEYMYILMTLFYYRNVENSQSLSFFGI